MKTMWSKSNSKQTISGVKASDTATIAISPRHDNSRANTGDTDS